MSCEFTAARRMGQEWRQLVLPAIPPWLEDIHVDEEFEMGVTTSAMNLQNLFIRKLHKHCWLSIGLLVQQFGFLIHIVMTDILLYWFTTLCSPAMHDFTKALHRFDTQNCLKEPVVIKASGYHQFRLNIKSYLNNGVECFNTAVNGSLVFLNFNLYLPHLNVTKKFLGNWTNSAASGLPSLKWTECVTNT